MRPVGDPWHQVCHQHREHGPWRPLVSPGMFLKLIRETGWTPHSKSILFKNLNPLWPSDTMWQDRMGSILTQVLACCLDGTTPLPEPMMTNHQCDPVTFFRGQIYNRYLSYQSLTLAWKLLPENLIQHSQGTNSGQAIIWTNGDQMGLFTGLWMHHLASTSSTDRAWQIPGSTTFHGLVQNQFNQVRFCLFAQTNPRVLNRINENLPLMIMTLFINAANMQRATSYQGSHKFIEGKILGNYHHRNYHQ